MLGSSRALWMPLPHAASAIAESRQATAFTAGFITLECSAPADGSIVLTPPVCLFSSGAVTINVSSCLAPVGHLVSGPEFLNVLTDETHHAFGVSNSVAPHVWRQQQARRRPQWVVGW